MRNIQTLFDKLPSASQAKARKMAEDLHSEFVGMNIDVMKAFFRCSLQDRNKIMSLMPMFHDGVADEFDRKAAEERIMSILYPGPI